MPQREHSAILSTFIKLPFVFKAFVLSIFEWSIKTGFTVHELDSGWRYGVGWVGVSRVWMFVTCINVRFTSLDVIMFSKIYKGSLKAQNHNVSIILY